jgi:hypothetical protein
LAALLQATRNIPIAFTNFPTQSAPASSIA